MANTIKIKRSAVAGKVPAVGDLELGELAINTFDGKLFLKKNVSGNETIVDVTTGGLDSTSLLNLLKTVDGSGSGLDADLLDGLNSSTSNTASTIVARDANSQISLSALNLDGAAVVTGTAGRLWFNGTTNQLNFSHDGVVTQQIGEETYVYVKASSAITEGRVIVRTGAISGSGAVSAAHAGTSLTSADTIIGIATQNIAADGYGRVTVFGVVRGLNTTGQPFGETWAEGDALYYSPSGNGALTKVRPTAPNIKCQVGTVIIAHQSDGAIQVDIQRGSTLGGTDSNVEVTSLANKDVLVYNSTNSRWENKQLTLGTDTTGNYIATIAGTANQITVTGSGSENSAVTLSLPQDIATTSTPTFAGLNIGSNSLATYITNTVNATPSNIASRVVARDETGGFSAGAINATSINTTGNVVVGGTLTVTGTITSAGVDNSSYSDALLELHKPIVNSVTGYVTSNDGLDIGIKYNYYDADPIGNKLPVFSGSGNGTTATLTVGAKYPVGGLITVTNVVPSGFNGTYRVTASTASTVSYSNTTVGSVTTTGQLGYTYLVPQIAITNAVKTSGNELTISYSPISVGTAVQTGDTVQLSGIVPTAYNAVYTVASAPTTGSFTVQVNNSGDVTSFVGALITLRNRYAFAGLSNDEQAFEFYRAGVESTPGVFGSGIYGTFKGGKFWAELNEGSESALIQEGLAIKIPNATVYDVDTATSGTVTHGSLVKLGTMNVGALNTGVTYGTLATLYIDGAPTTAQNATATNKYAIQVNSGDSYFGGSIKTNSQLVSTVATGTAPFSVASSTLVTNLNADLLDGQSGAYYLDWTNVINKPDPVVTVTLTGDVTGTANATLTDLGNGTVSVATTIAAGSVALGPDTTGNYVESITNGSYITGGNGGSEGAALTIAVDATSANTASKVVARDASGSFSAGTVNVNTLAIDNTLQDYATITTTATTQTALASFAAASYGSCEIMIQAAQGTLRHISKLLVVHDGTTAHATEFGAIQTSAKLFTTEVDISGGSVRILITPTGVTSTVFKAAYTLIGA